MTNHAVTPPANRYEDTLGAADIADACQRGQHVHADARALVGRDGVGDLAREQLQAVRHKFISGRDAETREDGRRLGAALLARDQHLCTRLSFRIGQHAVLLHDERTAQRNHEQHAENAAAQRDQADLQQAGDIAQPLVRPHEQRGQRENRAGRHRLTGGTDGLNHVVFQNRIPLEHHADDAHGDNRRGDGRRDGHADAQTQIRVGATEQNGKQAAENDGDRRKLRHYFICRDVGLEFLFFHV